MTTTPTPKLGLLLDSPDDAIDPFVDNFTRIDYAAGVIWVNAGVVPTDAELWDGAIVAEKTTGKVWLAQKNGGGTFDHIWLEYPFLARASIPGSTVASDTTFRTQALTALSGVNAGVLAGGTRITIPIKAIYDIDLQISWTANATGFRAGCWNGTVSGYSQRADIRPGHATHSIINSMSDSVLLEPGDNVCIGGWQTGGSTVAPNGGIISVSLKRPVQ